MLFMSDCDCLKYLNGLQSGLGRIFLEPALSGAAPEPTDAPAPTILVLHLPDNRRVRPVALAIDAILGEIGEEGRLLYIHQRGIWPTSEDPYLYSAVRGANDSQASVVDEPGHFFIVGENSKFCSFLCMAFDFGWGGIVAGAADDFSIFFNHDGLIAVACQSDKSQTAVDTLTRRQLKFEYGDIREYPGQ